MATRSCARIAPLSISWLSRNVVIPVSRSPLMMAQLIGAAPRYSGSSEACRLKVPRRGIAQTTSGSILKAMTIPRSGCNACKASRNAGSRNFSGCNTGTPSSRAAIFTSLSRRCRPAAGRFVGDGDRPDDVVPFGDEPPERRDGEFGRTHEDDAQRFRIHHVMLCIRVRQGCRRGRRPHFRSSRRPWCGVRSARDGRRRAAVR